MVVDFPGQERAVIERLLKVLGISRGWLVDVGALDGVFWSNVSFLIQRGWDALMIEAQPNNFQALVRNMSAHPQVRCALKTVGIEPENSLNSLLAEHGVPADFDLLNIDIDGNDYWVWKSLSATPKVVSIEYNSNFEPSERKVIEYDRSHTWQRDSYYGASALAFFELGKSKGYTLVEHTSKTNLFFVRNDLSAPFRPLPIEEVKRDPINQPSTRMMRDLGPVSGQGA